MSFPDPDQTTAAASYEAPGTPAAGMLRIVSGLHAGAVRRIQERSMLLLGSGDDCDIVLSDRGVAPHHALVSFIDGAVTVRALDAPLRVQGRTLEPGDPMALHGVQRIALGEAVLALGAEADPVWSEVLPGYAPAQAAPARSRVRGLPVAAAAAAIALATMAIYVAANPKLEHKPDVPQQLKALASEYGIDDARVANDPDGVPVLSGTIDTAAQRGSLQKRLSAAGIDAHLKLRTGEDIAHDVGEVLRSQSVNARTRYLGNGDVEVAGHFTDMPALVSAVQSRAMTEVEGVRRVLPRNLSAVADTTGVSTKQAAKAKPPVRLVAFVRGPQSYLLGSDGNRYVVGDALPSGGTLIALGERAYQLRDGVLEQVRISTGPDIARDVALGASTMGMQPVAPAARAPAPATPQVAAAAAAVPAQDS